MTILQMKCFISLVATKKLTVTANLYDLRVSTLSKYLNHMEDELSIKLFYKNQNRLELTKEGEIIYPSLQFIVKQYDDLKIHMNAFTNVGRTNVNIALAFHHAQIVKLLMSFARNSSNVNLSITETTASDIQYRLDTSSTDIAVIYEELLEKKYPYIFPISKDRIVAVVGRGHPLSAKESISVSELKDDTFFLFKGDRLMYQFQIHTCIAAGFAPTETHNDLRVNTIMEYVAANRGVSLLVENTVSCLKNENVVILPLAENPTLTLSMFSPAVYLTDTCERLVRFIENNYE